MLLKKELKLTPSFETLLSKFTQAHNSVGTLKVAERKYFYFCKRFSDFLAMDFLAEIFRPGFFGRDYSALTNLYVKVV